MNLAKKQWWVGGVSYDSDYQAVLDRGTALGYTLPSPSQQSIQNDLVLDLKSYGIWSLIDVFYNLVTDGDSNFALLNWKSPSLYQLTKTGTPSFATNSGYTSSASNYLNMPFTPSTNGVNYILGNASIFGSSISYGARNAGGGASYTFILADAGTGTNKYSINNSQINKTVGTDHTNKFIIINDIGTGSNCKGYVDGVHTYTGAGGSSKVPNLQLRIGALSGDGGNTGVSGLNKLAGLGASLEGKASNFSTAWYNYLNSI